MDMFGTVYGANYHERQAQRQPTTLTALVVGVIIQLLPASVKAGTCWMSVGDNGRCQELITASVSREECCSMTGATGGWTAHENVESGTLFYWIALAGGAPDCQPCHATCDNVFCGEGKRCRMKSGVPRCVCSPDCTGHHQRHRGAQCGTDGVTYRNTCSMLKHNCRNNAQVHTDYYGQCKMSCSDVECQRGQTCVTDQNGSPHCVSCRSFSSCPEPAIPQYVCGSDGVTYESPCHIRRSSCETNSQVTIAYQGRCQDGLTCDELTCPFGRSCLMHPRTLRPQCVTCDTPCEQLENASPVCGTDGNTYPTWCQLQRAACHSGIVITTQHNGPCGQGPPIMSNDLPLLEVIPGNTTPADHPAEMPSLS